MRHLLAEAARLDVDVATGNPVTRLLVEDGRVVGVHADGPRSGAYDLRASGVALAANGLGNNRELLHRWAPDILGAQYCGAHEFVELVEAGGVVEAPTVESLAERIGCPAAAVAAALEAYAAAAGNAEDPFGGTLSGMAPLRAPYCLVRSVPALSTPRAAWTSPGPETCCASTAAPSPVCSPTAAWPPACPGRAATPPATHCSR
jgi:hypothetical protein